MSQSICNHLTVLLVLIATPALMGGCGAKKKKNQAEDPGYGVPETPAGKDRIVHDTRNWCKLKKSVTNPAAKSAEATIQQALIAARTAGQAKEADAKKTASKAFRNLFLPASRSYVGSFWRPAMKNWSRYLDKKAKQGAFPYQICTDSTQGKERRVTILSFDKKKSNPPIVLSKDAQGVWKIQKMTPF